MTSVKANILLARPYLSEPVQDYIKDHQGIVRLLVDSGAFTTWKANKRPSTVDQYCDFLDKLKIKPWRYFTLDVIGEPDATRRNYDILLSRGYKPVPIFTRGESIEVLEYYYSTSDVVGIGGLVGTPGHRGFVNGIMRHAKGRRVHWLGFCNAEFLKHYRPYSCDSTTMLLSWTNFRFIPLYVGGGKVVRLQADKCKNQPLRVRRALASYGFSLNDLAKPGFWERQPGSVLVGRCVARETADYEKHLNVLKFIACATVDDVRCVVEGRYSENQSLKDSAA